MNTSTYSPLTPVSKSYAVIVTSAPLGKMTGTFSCGQAYPRRVASLLAPSQSEALYTVVPKHEQPALKQLPRSALLSDASLHATQLGAAAHESIVVTRRSTDSPHARFTCANEPTSVFSVALYGVYWLWLVSSRSR